MPALMRIAGDADEPGGDDDGDACHFLPAERFAEEIVAENDGIDDGQIRKRGDGEFLPDSIGAGKRQLRGETARTNAEQIGQGGKRRRVPALSGG